MSESQSESAVQNRRLRPWKGSFMCLAACMVATLAGGCRMITGDSIISGPPISDPQKAEKLRKQILTTSSKPTMRPSSWSNWIERWKPIEVISMNEYPGRPDRAVCVVKYDVERVIRGSQIAPKRRIEIKKQTVYYRKEPELREKKSGPPAKVKTASDSGKPLPPSGTR